MQYLQYMLNFGMELLSFLYKKSRTGLLQFWLRSELREKCRCVSEAGHSVSAGHFCNSLQFVFTSRKPYCLDGPITEDTGLKFSLEQYAVESKKYHIGQKYLLNII